MKIKNIGTTIFVLTIFSIAMAFASPTFDDPYAVVLDSNAAPGKAKDKVKLVNMTDEDGLKFAVHFYDEKTQSWILYGKGEVEEYYSDKSIESPFEDKIKPFRYFAIIPLDKKEYRYSLEKRNNDVRINIFPTKESDDKARIANSTIIDAQEVSGKFKDNIKFINQTDDAPISFWVYASNAQDDSWQKVGVAVLKTVGDTDSIDSPLEDILHTFRYFAISARNGKKYKLFPEKRKNDLYIYVQ